MKNIHTLIALVLFCKLGCSAQTISGQVEGHDYVDLGLPSGTKWATCNVCATEPTAYGDYFAWGETKPKDNYRWSTYKWCENKKTDQIHIPHDFTKYCTDSTYGTVDNKMELEADDDAATINWGDDWRMPTLEEIRELYYNCKWEWTYDYNSSGVAGIVGKSTENNNTIFFPATGFRIGPDVYNVGEYENFYLGYCWSSSLLKKNSNSSRVLIFSDHRLVQSSYDYIDWRIPISRAFGLNVRAVVR